jgi:hypothetical protein
MDKNSNKPNEKKSQDLTVDIPVDGSLGILAYGHRGLEAWRKKKAEVEQQTKNNTK